LLSGRVIVAIVRGGLRRYNRCDGASPILSIAFGEAVNYDAARANMIESQIRPNKVTDEGVLMAFGRIRRELFVPQALRGVAYSDENLPLGRGRHLMAPMVTARLLQAAAIVRTDSVLVVGAATGYEAALASVLARTVVALEADEELARLGRAALVEQGIATVYPVQGALRPGHRARAPYDVIVFAGAVAEMPAEIAAQLAEDGRALAVIRPESGVGRATLTTRSGGVLGQRALFDAAVPQLPGFARDAAFVF
jgi:protein-L-isoaspartate(D-aspartate) O-methyltransferase